VIGIEGAMGHQGYYGERGSKGCEGQLGILVKTLIHILVINDKKN
jgi:hypothetical protein